MKALLIFLFSLLGVGARAQKKAEGLFINSKAPEFNLKDQNGNNVSLRDLRKKGPVVLVFYRGNWCPYCNRELKNLQDSLSLLTERKATVVAITPEAAAGIQETIKKTGANFSLLSDVDMKVSTAYDVAFSVDERTLGRYKAGNIDLLQINNEKETAMLPVPAVYIVNRDGTITYRYFRENYRTRPSVRELLDQLNQ